MNTSCEFNFDEVTVTSVINIMDGDVELTTKVSRKAQRSVIRPLWPKGVVSTAT